PGRARPRPRERRAPGGHQGGRRERLVRGPSLGHRGRVQGLRRELRRRGAPRQAALRGSGARGRGVRRGGGGVVRRAPAAPQAPAPEPPARRALGPAAFGPLLIGAGALFLVDRFAWALGIRSLLWALLSGVGAALFLLLYARDRRQWWRPWSPATSAADCSWASPAPPAWRSTCAAGGAGCCSPAARSSAWR